MGELIQSIAILLVAAAGVFNAVNLYHHVKFYWNVEREHYAQSREISSEGYARKDSDEETEF